MLRAKRFSHAGNSHCNSLCLPKCVKPSSPSCPKCPEDAFELAGTFPYKKHFECLTREQLIELLNWAEKYRLWYVPSPAHSVVYAALHFWKIGEVQELETTSQLGIMGEKQVSRPRKRSEGDYWSGTYWGLAYRDLLDHPLQGFVISY